MSIPNYTAEDLKKLPLRAIVALSVRCARRVEALALLPEDHARADDCRAAVKAALQMAEDFARGAACTSCESVISAIEACRDTAQGEIVRANAIAAVVQAAYAAATALNADLLEREPEERHLFSPPTRPFAHLANVTAEIATLDAFTTAVDAADAVGYSEDLIRRSVGDYQRLLNLNLGSYPFAGQPIDPSPDGPLGPL